MELTVGGKSFAEVKIQSGIFQGDAHLPLLFVIAMMPLNTYLRRTLRVTYLQNYKFYDQMYMDDIKLSAKGKKRIQDFETNSEKIKSGYRN